MYLAVIIASITASLLQCTNANPVPPLSDVLPPSRITDALSFFHDFLNSAAPDSSTIAKDGIDAAFATMYGVVGGNITVTPRSLLPSPAALEKHKKASIPDGSILPPADTELPAFIAQIDRLLCAVFQCHRPSWSLRVCAPDASTCPLWPGYPISLPPLLEPVAALDELMAWANGTLPIPPVESRRPVDLLALSPDGLAQALDALADFIATWRKEFDAGTLAVRDAKRAPYETLGKRFKLEMSETETMVAGAVVVAGICIVAGPWCGLALIAGLTQD